MRKVKYITLLFIIITLLLIIPNFSNAAMYSYTEYTYSDAEQGIEWSYKLDDSDNAINLRCKTTSKIGTVTIPSTIDGKKVISLNGAYLERSIPKLCWNNKCNNTKYNNNYR